MLADSDRSDAGPAGRPDCVITVLPGGQAGLGPAERRALRALAEAGLIPPLRPAAPEHGHRSDTSPSFTTRTRLRRVNTRPRVGESVETALALH
jgi:hypothetical protein